MLSSLSSQLLSHLKMRSFVVIVAASAANFGIGKNGGLPWRLPGDMAEFKRVTSTTQHPGKQNAVIMGRKTWQSIPEKFRPLSNRLNVVLSSNPAAAQELCLPEGVVHAHSFDEALRRLCDDESIEEVFVIGGEAVYREALKSQLCKRVLMTSVQGEFDCDTFMPPIPAQRFDLVHESPEHEDNGIRYTFQRYENRLFARAQAKQAAAAGAEAGTETEAKSEDGNPEEQAYLDAVRDIIENGVERTDRTGVGTKAKFGLQMRFSLRDNVFPLLTTKRVFWRGVAEELLWFVAGCTNANKLREKGIHIWDGNGSREFLDKRGLTHHEEGDLGPVYGFQWRHYGAEYTNMHDDYTGKGIDQLQRCIDLIKSNPSDRRIIMSAWNPADVDKMALPPCHMFCQFFVANGELSCQMYQRSADMGLGVPFNIASYSLLTRMMAQVCGLQPGEFVHTIGDAHVYLNHIDALRRQLVRKPRRFPKLHINPAKTDIDSFEFSDFTVEGYDPYPTIKMDMAV